MPSGIKPHQNLETEPQRLDFGPVNRAFEARDVTDWYSFRTSLLTKLFGFYGQLAIFAHFLSVQVFKFSTCTTNETPILTPNPNTNRFEPTTASLSLSFILNPNLKAVTLRSFFKKGSHLRERFGDARVMGIG